LRRTNGKDATNEPVEDTPPHEMLDLVPTEAEQEQLPPRHDLVLTPRQHSHLVVT
jgi:hypothetical protein